MSAAVARAQGQDTVFSLTGVGPGCGAPMQTVTGSGTCQVYCNGYPVVRIGDRVGAHPFVGCGPDLSTLSTSSPTVFVGGMGLARIGDQYTADNTITTGSSTVFCG